MNYYAELRTARCTIEHHESDLYVLATPEARKLAEGAPNRSFFSSQIDGRTWIELPFAYTPFWDKVSNRA